MTPQKRMSWRRYWRSYRACLLPFAGVLVVLLYLLMFSVYRDWGVGKPKAGAPTDVKAFYFDELFSLRGNLGVARVAELDNAITAKQVVIWGYATGLVGLSLLSAILISGYVIWKGPRDLGRAKRWAATLSILSLVLVVHPYISKKALGKFTVIAKHFWYVISSQLTPNHGLVNLVNLEMLVVALGYAVSLVLAFACSATLLPLKEIEQTPSSLDIRKIEDGAKYVAMQMKHLRLILYIGAILLVVITFRHRMTLSWALDYLKPIPLLEGYPKYKFANVVYGHLEGLTTNIVTGTSVLNTLLLAVLYVPSALLLQSRAVRLSAVAVRLQPQPTAQSTAPEKVAGKDEKTSAVMSVQDTWLKNHGLIFPFREQLPKVIAILSPLLAAPIGELLNLFK